MKNQSLQYRGSKERSKKKKRCKILPTTCISNSWLKSISLNKLSRSVHLSKNFTTLLKFMPLNEFQTLKFELSRLPLIINIKRSPLIFMLRDFCKRCNWINPSTNFLLESLLLELICSVWFWPLYHRIIIFLKNCIIIFNGESAFGILSQGDLQKQVTL